MRCSLALTAVASSCVAAFGIDCHGSSNCVFFHNNDILEWKQSLHQEIAAYVSDSA
jgi:hypothetical protein